MRILITSSSLARRPGSEPRVRDLVRGLEGRGHAVMVHGSNPAHTERLLETDPTPVATDLENLALKPDVIHGLHPLNTLAALLALPGIPAILHAGDEGSRFPFPRHPRIHRYLAPRGPVARRLFEEEGIVRTKVTEFFDGVDTDRFATLRDPPPTPHRVLWLGPRPLGGSQWSRTLSTVMANHGLVIDHGIGDMKGGNETVLPGYDVVLAAGSRAVEAMACGCAVIIADRNRCGALIRPENFDRMSRAGFTPDASPDGSDMDRLESALLSYSVEACHEVATRTRRDLSLRAALPRLEELYEDAIANKDSSAADIVTELRETGAFIRRSELMLMRACVMTGGKLPNEPLPAPKPRSPTPLAAL